MFLKKINELMNPLTNIPRPVRLSELSQGRFLKIKRKGNVNKRFLKKIIKTPFLIHIPWPVRYPKAVPKKIIKSPSLMHILSSKGRSYTSSDSESNDSNNSELKAIKKKGR
jgi:hypothetical protein